MLAGFAAAYMSTVATQLNWGASYLINDFYKRFVRPGRGEKHYVNAARLATVFLFGASLLVTWQLATVESAWKFLLALGAGTGLVLILRWYWWRINAWSEISAMVTSFIVSLLAFAYVRPRFAAEDPNGDAWVMLITVAVSTVVWVAVTFHGPGIGRDAGRVLPARAAGRPGWVAVVRRLRPREDSRRRAGVDQLARRDRAVYATLFGIGKLVFGDLGWASASSAIAGLAFAWIARSFRSDRMASEAVPDSTTAVPAD